MPGVVVYKCPGGGYSLYPDRRDCPGMGPGGTVSIDTGGSGTTRIATRFLGARSKVVDSAELASLYFPATPKPDVLNRRRLILIGVAGFALVLVLLLLARRRKR